MIVIGYQGIGKSTLASKDLKFIDLESSSFFVDGKRDDNWYKIYCNIAERLSKEGYTVFTSSHEVVRNELKKSSEKVICCVPAINLKDLWIIKLAKRYKESNLEKDYKAYMNAKCCYEENIKEIMDSGFKTIVITNMNYDLSKLISYEL